MNVTIQPVSYTHLLQGDAQLEHEDHHVVGQVGNLIDGLLPVLRLAGDDDLGGLLPHLFQDFVQSLVKKVGGVGPLLGLVLDVYKRQGGTFPE